jgi:cellulose synthase/poly-beta-1,6-N-acetylglucosamine synthase-like glycosyltransferase
MMLKILFWIFFLAIVYTYIGYTLLLLLLALAKRIVQRNKIKKTVPYEPGVTLIIPAYNEADYIDSKVENSFSLDYPREKLQILWVTDGSNDKSNELLAAYPGLKVIYENERRGKIHAMNRAIKLVDTPIVVFTDANTMLNSQAIREMVKFFADDCVGCVAGEKRIRRSEKEKAVGAGEGLYWEYESLIKKLESETGSAIGAVGELFAIRRELYDEVKEDSILDDFTISLHIARKGYHIKYAPLAWGTETASVSISEEIKRKVRIATGGIQTLLRMTPLLNPLHNGLLSFKYFSHKVLRWTLVPFSFPLMLLLNIIIIATPALSSPIYIILLILQCIFYLFVITGALLHNIKLSAKFLFAPYYLFIMNYSSLKGFFCYFSGKYSVKWTKVKRS